MPYKPKEEICLNSTRTAVVSCDSPQAHFKLSPPNAELSDEEAKALGLVKAEKPVPAAKPAVAEDVDAPVEPEKKAVNGAPQNKAIVMPNKDKK
jgi:hypothetical protein